VVTSQLLRLDIEDVTLAKGLAELCGTHSAGLVRGLGVTFGVVFSMAGSCIVRGEAGVCLLLAVSVLLTPGCAAEATNLSGSGFVVESWTLTTGSSLIEGDLVVSGDDSAVASAQVCVVETSSSSSFSASGCVLSFAGLAAIGVTG